MSEMTVHKFVILLSTLFFQSVLLVKKKILTSLIIFSCVALFISSVWTGKKA